MKILKSFGRFVRNLILGSLLAALPMFLIYTFQREAAIAAMVVGSVTALSLIGKLIYEKWLAWVTT